MASTSDFGSENRGSNPRGTTKLKNFKIFFIFSKLF